MRRNFINHNDLAFCGLIYWGILNLTGEHAETKELDPFKKAVEYFNEPDHLSEVKPARHSVIYSIIYCDTGFYWM
jgi:hypothetical protein